MSKLVTRNKKGTATRVTSLQVAQRPIKDTFCKLIRNAYNLSKKTEKIQRRELSRMNRMKEAIRKEKASFLNASSCVQVRKVERTVIPGRLK